MNLRCLVVGAVIGALLIGVSVALFCQRPVVKPPAVAVKPDTVPVVKDGETTYVIEYKVDPAASKELTKLRDELTGYRGTIERITGLLAEMELENQYLADSLARVTLDSLRGIVKVVRGPAGIVVFDYKDGLVRKSSERIWRQRFTVLAGKDRQKPTVKTSRFPVDLGLAAVAGFTTDPMQWSPVPTGWLGLAITHEQMTATVGPYYDGKLKLRGEVRLDWRF